MAKIRCKQCGGELDLAPGVTAGECPYCGTLSTYPKLADGMAEQLYNRAEHFRQINDFDRAEQAYSQYIQASPQDPEGYWGLLLSRFGIEYVEDPATHERIPTCHRVQDSPVTSDPDYLQAVELAVGSDRDIYEREAERIEEIRRKIIAISAQEKPYDVFICYKESTDGGTRTKDSVDAQEIYYQLTNQGYKVFFSRITLEGKLGKEYEPYIFAALNSAKVMLVIGSCKEFFEAVWVRNEWSRFIALMKKNPSKLIIPCFKGMSPYDLPPELSRFQAQDMSKIGFIQDLLHGIKKVINKEGEKQGGSGSSSGSDKLANLLRRAKLFAENGDFDSAREYCEKYLDQDAENGYAYFYRLMAELQVTNEEALFKVNDLPEQKSFKLALRFAEGQLKAKLDGFLKARADAKAAEERRRQEEERRRQEEERRRQEEERRRQEEDRIRSDSRERAERLKRHIKAERSLHGETVLCKELLCCLDAEQQLSYCLDAQNEAQVRKASETAMAQAGSLSELEAKVGRKQFKILSIAFSICLAIALLAVKVHSCMEERQRIEWGLTCARSAERDSKWRDAASHAKAVLAIDPGHAEAKTLLAKAEYIIPELEKAETARKNFRWEDLLKHARNILEKAPDDAAAKALRAQAEYIIPELEKAETAKKNSRWEDLLKHARNILAKAPDDGTAKNLQTLAEANRGSAEAQYKLGECYFSGKGVAKDEAEGVKWLRKAAEQGLVEAQYKLGECYLSGKGVVKDEAEAAKWLRIAAEQGHAGAKDLHTLAEEFEQAKRGNGIAQYKLGNRYLSGKGVAQNEAEGVKWLRKAAEQGHSEAQYKLGECYLSGKGVVKDEAEAAKWLRMAAEQGLVEAQYKLGECYFSGKGVAKDGVEAIKWLRKAAEQGHAGAKDLHSLAEEFEQAKRGNAIAQYKLGGRYLSGNGVVKDEAEAAKWLRKAAEQGVFSLPGGVPLKMVKIEPGSFMMGSPKDEKGRRFDEKLHRVTLTKAYWLGKYEVTQKQWQAVMGNNPSYFKKGDNYPVEKVSWNDAKKFCDKMNELYAGKLPEGYRFDLPTEAQWEYACRAGTTTALNNGKDLDSGNGTLNLDEVGWYGENSNRSTHPVGRKRPNAWGLYDMHGNVSEWCRDWYDGYGGDAVDPIGPAGGSRRGSVTLAERTIRGGCLGSDARGCRSASRGYVVGLPGFRLALVPDETAAVWYRKDAEQGRAEAQYKLGLSYLSGKGVAQNEAEGVKWLRKAAEQGHGEALYKLGECYLSGRGVVKDEAEGVKWLRKAAEQGVFSLPGGVPLKMVKIVPGSFMMGSPENENWRDADEKLHRVTLTKAYWLGKYEVTQKQWQAVMGNNPSLSEKGDNYPVEWVSWDDAKKFCNKMNRLCAGILPEGYRFDLPTEAQWEYACRAGTTTALNNGKELISRAHRYLCPNLDEVGWYNGNSNQSTHPVGGKRPNAWGLYDMHGNVSEWCRDWYDGYGGDATDPTGPARGSKRVNRGGGRDGYAKRCRSAFRAEDDPGSRSRSLGFRLALVPVQ